MFNRGREMIYLRINKNSLEGNVFVLIKQFYKIQSLSLIKTCLGGKKSSITKLYLVRQIEASE